MQVDVKFENKSNITGVCWIEQPNGELNWVGWHLISTKCAGACLNKLTAEIEVGRVQLQV